MPLPPYYLEVVMVSGGATLEVSLDAIPTTDLFDTFTKTLCVGNDNMTLTLHSLVGSLGTVVAPIINLSGRPVKSFLHLVQVSGRPVKSFLHLYKVEKRLNRSTRQVNDGGNNSAQTANQGVQSKGHIVIPYTQGLCESIKKICGRYGIQTHFKGGTTTNHNNFQIIGREGHNLARNIKESIYIRVNNPSLNNNIGKFNLSHIWDRVLLNTKGLTLK